MQSPGEKKKMAWIYSLVLNAVSYLIAAAFSNWFCWELFLSPVPLKTDTLEWWAPMRPCCFQLNHKKWDCEEMRRRWTLSTLESSLWRDVCNQGAFKKSFLPSVIDFTISWTRQNAQLALKAWGQIECVSYNIILTCSYLIMAGKIQNKALNMIDIWHCLSRRCIIIISFSFLKSTLSIPKRQDEL